MSLHCLAAMEFPGCSPWELCGRDFCREFVFPVAFELFCHAAIMRTSSRTGICHTLWVLQEHQLSLSLSLCNCMIIYNSNNDSDRHYRSRFSSPSKKVLLYSKASRDYSFHTFYGSWPQVQCIFTYPYKQGNTSISPSMLWGMGKHLKAWA